MNELTNRGDYFYFLVDKLQSISQVKETCASWITEINEVSFV